MKLRCLLVCCLLSAGWVAVADSAEWLEASPTRSISFPRDHYVHDGFRTEWWYFVGNLQNSQGRRFGYQLTLFRRGVRPPGSAAAESSFVRDWFAFAHYAVSDLSGGDYWHDQTIVRGGFGEAAFPDDGQLVARIDEAVVERLKEEQWRISAITEAFSYDFTLTVERGPVLQGKAGYSQKAAGASQASMYYSIPRLRTEGTIRIGERVETVTGLSWLDREWASNQLAEDQAGWDWFSLQADDGSDLMLYQLRKKNGETDPFSKGLWWPADGEPEVVQWPDYQLEPLEWWQSDDGKTRYPVSWRVTIPEKQIEFEVRAALRDQELRLDPIRYWEGAVTFQGQRGDRAFGGRGYLEMTGYGEALKPLSR